MTWRGGLLAAGAVASLSAAAAAWWLWPTRHEGPPNVLFVVWDTVRADRLSLYGHDKPTTPFLDRMASRAAVFEQAVSPSYWTLPSHASLFTGLPVAVHGANADYKWLDNRFVTMAEHYGSNGYDTYAWSSNPNINRSANTVQGFETFHQPFGNNPWRAKVEEASRLLLHPDDQTTRDDPERYRNIAHHKSGKVTHEAFSAWLHDHRDPERPFFAFLNYMEAHAYRLPTEPSRRAIMPDEESYQRALATPNLLRRQTNVMFGNWRPYTRGQRQGLYDLYDASIRDLDAYLEGVYAELERAGVADHTVVVVTSDHGEHLGEHGLYLHNFSVYEPLVRVPLWIFGPGVSAGRRSAPVSTAALFHTLNQLSGLPQPAQPILDHDLLGPTSRTVVTELDVPCGNPENRRLDRSIRDWTATYRAVYDGRMKLIEASNGLHELYDLATDPKETTNLYGQVDATALHTSLAAWSEALPTLELSDGERAAEDAARAAEVDDELFDQLEELGYVE